MPDNTDIITLDGTVLTDFRFFPVVTLNMERSTEILWAGKKFL